MVRTDQEHELFTRLMNRCEVVNRFVNIANRSGGDVYRRDLHLIRWPWVRAFLGLNSHIKRRQHPPELLHQDLLEILLRELVFYNLMARAGERAGVTEAMRVLFVTLAEANIEKYQNIRGFS